MTTTTDLHRVIYISHAVGDLKQGDLDAILAKARAFNPTIGATGLLLFHEGSFIQILEGAPDALSGLMQRIRMDRRHSGIIQMESRPAATRVFSEWSMGYVPVVTGAQREGFVNLRAFAEDPKALASSPDRAVETQISAFLSFFREFADA